MYGDREKDGPKVQSEETILTLTPVASLQTPQTNLRFDNLVEGLTELTKSCFTYAYILL